LDPVCSLGAGNAAKGHYVFSGTRTEMKTTVAVLYQWQLDSEPDALGDQST
jgi:hypothetical protein